MNKKTTLIIVTLLVALGNVYCQQTPSNNFTDSKTNTSKKITFKTTTINNKGDSTTKIETTDSVQSSSSDRVFITAGGTTDALTLSQISAAGQFNTHIRLDTIHSWNLSAGFNFSGNIKTENADSITKASIYFPDIGSSAFLASMEYSPMGKGFKNNNPDWDFLIVGEYSIQKRNISFTNATTNKDTTYTFTMDNFDIGIRARWKHKSSDGKNSLVASLTVLPFDRITIIQNVDNSFSQVFSKTFNTTNQGLSLQYTGLSTVFAVEYNNALVYFRTYNLYPMGHNNFYFSVGVKATAKFFSF
jgi:hypothetical protein